MLSEIMLKSVKKVDFLNIVAVIRERYPSPAHYETTATWRNNDPRSHESREPIVPYLPQGSINMVYFS